MMKSALAALIALGASANEYESLGQGQCVDAAGQEVSNYFVWHEGLGADCQSVCDADDECKAFSGFVERDVCVLYAPSRSSVPDGHPTWFWVDLSHDSVTKAVHAGSYAKAPDCMLKKAAIADAILTVGAKVTGADEYQSLGQGQCVDATGQEVSKYGHYYDGAGAICQSICDADDECTAYNAYDERDVCELYSPGRSSSPKEDWYWVDLSHDSVTKAVHAGSYAKAPDCMLKKAATAQVVVTAELSSSSAVGNYLAKWVKSQDGTYVTSKAQGTHNCWDLAMAALEHARSAGYGPLRIKSSYVWSSQKVSYQNAQPGDIMQFSYYEELYQGYKLRTDDHHTAVVTKAYSGGGIEVREQNPDKCGRSVYHPGSKTAGSVTIYRMSSSSEEDASEFLV